MSDAFERAVRDAAAQLGRGGEPPGYHDAWRRGTRRRYAKRAVVAGLGVVMLGALLSVDLDRLPGRSTTIESDDLAVSAGAAPGDAGPPVLPPTTGPIGETPADSPPPVPTEGDVPPTAAATATPTPQGEDAVVTPPVDGGAPTPTPTTRAAPGPTTPPAAATPNTVAPTPTPPEPTPNVFELPTPTPTVPAIAAQEPTPDTGPSTAPDGPDPTETGGPSPNATAEVPNTTPEPALAPGVGGPADAEIAGPLAVDTPQECTTANGDKWICTLLVPYACAPGEPTRAGYEAVDTTADGQADLCVPLATTFCDLDGDGLGDVACSIEAPPANVTAEIAPTEG